MDVAAAQILNLGKSAGKQENVQLLWVADDGKIAGYPGTVPCFHPAPWSIWIYRCTDVRM